MLLELSLQWPPASITGERQSLQVLVSPGKSTFWLQTRHSNILYLCENVVNYITYVQRSSRLFFWAINGYIHVLGTNSGSLFGLVVCKFWMLTDGAEPGKPPVWTLPRLGHGNYSSCYHVYCRTWQDFTVFFVKSKKNLLKWIMYDLDLSWRLLALMFPHISVKIASSMTAWQNGNRYILR